MDLILEYLKAGEIVVGLLVLLFTSLMTLFVWWDRRARGYVDTQASVAKETNLRVIERLTAVEDDLKRVDDEIGELKTTVAKLPKAEDIVGLRVALGEQGATLRQIQGLVRTLYEAAVRASEASK